jgi:transposase-like protein
MKHYSPEAKLRILSDWRGSGVSATAFAQQCGVSATTLYEWRKQQDASNAPPAFRPVLVRDSAESASATAASTEQVVERPIAVLEHGGVRATVFADIDARLLAALVASLRGGAR